MELGLVTHYSRSLRRAYDRSISEQKYENHHHYTEDIFFKGQNLKERSYQALDNLRAKDLRIADKSTQEQKQPNHQRNGLCSSRIKREEEQEEETTTKTIRRYFCIFCKMDFSNSCEFLDHLELHPNGSFVLVKRDLISPQLSPKVHHHLHNINNNNNSTSNNNNNNNNNHNDNNDIADDNSEKNQISQKHFETEEETSNLPIIPEMLKNQIKIEPISEDEDDDDNADHINNNRSTIEENPQNFSETNESNFNSSSPLSSNNNNNNNNNNNSETGDPNHQLLVLSNPRLGDGPGEYLCNVCHAKFVYKNNLKSHLKRHLGIYPYVCFCGKRYQFKCKLNKHIEQAHAKIKNFKCPVPTCPKKYFTRNDLAFHISVTHQERQEIPCNICQKVFNSQKSLQIHCRKYHRSES